MRIYIPATLELLRQFRDSELYGPAPVTAFAVTPAVRQWYTTGDIEELEYAVFLDAARASLRLLEADPIAPRRRVVLSVDVADARVIVRPDLDRAVVRVSEPIEYGDLACVHVDGHEATKVVAAAASSMLAAELGEQDAQFKVDTAEDFELEWYDVTEVGELLR